MAHRGKAADDPVAAQRRGQSQARFTAFGRVVGPRVRGEEVLALEIELCQPRNLIGAYQLRPRLLAELFLQQRRGPYWGFDVLTGAELGPVAARSTDPIRVNNALRRAIRSAVSTLTLTDPDPARRLEAANAAFRSPDPEQLAAIGAALAAEQDPAVRLALEQAQAAARLGSDADVAARVAAIGVVARRGGEAFGKTAMMRSPDIRAMPMKACSRARSRRQS